MMAKSLGQIHSVNYRLENIQNTAKIGQIDLAGALTDQLQHMVRQGNYFKVVGIDAVITDHGAGTGGGQITGKLRYYSPTRGRCAAYRKAFQAMALAMKNQGISMRDNKLYDFRVNFQDPAGLDSDQRVKNAAVLDGGTHPLALANAGADHASIFGTFNEQQQPKEASAATYSSGFHTLGTQTNPTNFVTNESATSYRGTELFADATSEAIDFQLTYDPGTTDVSTTLQWRPDPALFLAVAFGLFKIEIDEIDLDSGASGLNLDINIMVSGWKSIMGDPDKRQKRRASAKKATMSRGGK